MGSPSGSGREVREGEGQGSGEMKECDCLKMLLTISSRVNDLPKVTRPGWGQRGGQLREGLTQSRSFHWQCAHLLHAETFKDS